MTSSPRFGVAGDAATEGDAAEMAGSGPDQEQALRLLLVDDVEVERLMVKRAIQRTGLAGTTVHEASDADAALQLLAESVARLAPFDCILLDYELIGETGLEILGRLRDARVDVPVIMLTGRSDPATVATLMKAGAVDLLTKDAITPERLEQSVRTAVRVARAERALESHRALLETTLRSIGDAVLVVDARTVLSFVNPAAERLIGVATRDGVGRRLEDVVRVVGANERDEAEGAAPGLAERVASVLAGRRTDERADMTLIARDGTRRIVDVTVTPLRAGSQQRAGGAVIALRDVTARRRDEAALADANHSLQLQAETLEQQAVELESQFEEARMLAEELEESNEELMVANAASERSEARYRALVEASAQLVWTTDARGALTDNPAWRALTGQTAEAARQQGWLDAVHPDDREGARRAWLEALATRRPYASEYRLRMASGAYRWHRARGVPVIGADGEIREWVGTIVDMDEEHRAEDSRREEADLVETLHRIGGVLTSELDVERLVQTVTDAATALTGAQFGAFFYNVIDRTGEKFTLYTLSGAPREAFENFGHPRATPVFAPTFHGEGIVRSDDITKDPRYGKLPPHHGQPKGHLPVRSYLAVPVVSRHGEVIGGLFFGHAQVGVFTERAERLAAGIATSAAVAMDNARLYEAERRARAEAESANRTKSEFLANMSHELRTPLNAIGGYASLVLEGIRGPITDAQRSDLERIRRSQHHLLGLINDILNFAKIEAGRVRFDPSDVAMDEALAELEVLIAPQLREKSLRYSYHECDVRPMAHVDPERLQQILLNLLSNAVKFTPPEGEVRVECDATPTSVVVRVIDTGIGIPPDKLEQVFEPFIQLERGQSGANAGTGLGLAISRDLARAMGGDLSASSTLDRGSTFTLTLPRA